MGLQIGRETGGCSGVVYSLCKFKNVEDQHEWAFICVYGHSLIEREDFCGMNYQGWEVGGRFLGA